MRFTAPKTGFTAAINAVLGATATTGDEVYGAIQIEAHQIDQSISLRAVSPDMAISTKVSGAVEADGVAMAPARILSSVARVADGADVDVELIGTELHFTGRSGSITCRTLTENQFPYPKLAPPPEFAIVDGEEFRRGVAMASQCTIKDTPMPYSGLRLRAKGGQVDITGCDGNRVSLVTIGETSGEFEGILPLKSSAVASRVAAKVVEFALSGDDNRVGFRAGDTVMRARVMSGDYPPVEKIIPEVADTLVTVNLPDLLGTLGRIKTVAKSGAADLVKIQLTTGEKDVTISCKGLLGSVQERLEAEVTGPLIVGMEMKWQYFVDGLEHMEPEHPAVLGFIAAKSNALLVRQRNWAYMAMPIGIKKP